MEGKILISNTHRSQVTEENLVLEPYEALVLYCPAV